MSNFKKLHQDNAKCLLVFRMISMWVILLLTSLVLAGCASTQSKNGAPPRVNENHAADAVPIPVAYSRHGNPASYVVRGKRYHVLKTTKDYDKTGYASWYGTKFHGRLTSTREPYDMHAMTAASTVLPIPSYVHVTNLANGRSVVVKVNDRGPFKSDRIIDLSYAAAKKLGYINKGVGHVRVTGIDASNSKTILASKKQHETAIKAHLKDKPAPVEKHKIELAQAQIETSAPEAAVVPVKLAQKKSEPVYLQVGAFKNHDAAISVREKIAQLTDMAVSVKKSDRKDQPIYLVKIGPLKTDDASSKVTAMLAKNGFEKPIEVKEG